MSLLSSFSLQEKSQSGKIIKVALVGNPNSGKSTLFNALTGLHQKTGNFPGVTVEKKSARIGMRFEPAAKPVTVEFIDLPGCYSLYPKSADEKVTHGILCDPSNSDHPDLVIFIADVTNLRRSLFMVTQLIDLKMPLILALNMMDIAEEAKLRIDTRKLSELLGIAVVEVSARNKKGIDGLKKSMGAVLPVPSESILDLRKFTPGLHALAEEAGLSGDYAFFHLMGVYEQAAFLSPSEKKRLYELKEKSGFDAGKFQAEESIERYALIDSIIEKVVSESGKHRNYIITEKIDKVLTHPFWGYFVFLIILFLLFQSVFFLAAYPMQWIESLFILASQWGSLHLPEGALSALLINGVLAGLSGVIVFIPQIALLFAFIAILEDTGYMARVSFIMDRLLRKAGLNGRSVIPLVGGVACAVPAIMSARTIGNWKERIITIMVTPLMSCSARLPVYTLLISILFPEENRGFLNRQGMLLMALYLIGFLAAIGSALVLKYIIKARERSFFIMELPVYRWPQWSGVGYTILEKVKVFIFDAGKIIVAVSVVLWMLSSHAPGTAFEDIEKRYASAGINEELSPGIKAEMAGEKLEASYAGIMGKTLEPFVMPLGFDWKIGIALVTSFAAREVFVGTMATIYSVADEDNTASIREKMLAEINPATGEKLYNRATGFSLLIFYAFAMQCMSTLAIVYRETGNWKWPFIQFVYMGLLAYVSSFAVYQIFS